MARLLSGIIVPCGQAKPPEARLALRPHVVCSWGWGVQVVCIKASIYMTKVTHFSLLHIVWWLAGRWGETNFWRHHWSKCFFTCARCSWKWWVFVPIYGLKHCGRPSREWIVMREPRVSFTHTSSVPHNRSHSECMLHTASYKVKRGNSVNGVTL